MHHALKDRYLARARAAEVVLLVASVVFCATTFAPDALLTGVGLSARDSRLGLGVASVAAFAASLVLLVIDWKGWAARHTDAAAKWSSVLSRFREHQEEDGGWPADVAEELHRAYWEASYHSVEVPDRQFNVLKAKYLLKVEISKRIQAHPGAPRCLLWLLVRFSGTARAIRSEVERDREGGRDERPMVGKPD